MSQAFHYFIKANLKKKAEENKPSKKNSRQDFNFVLHDRAISPILVTAYP